MEDERTVCIPCGEPAKRLAYGTDGRGGKYICEDPCPDFAVPGLVHYYLEMDEVFPAGMRRRISDLLVKKGPTKGAETYHIMTIEEVEEATGIKWPR